MSEFFFEKLIEWRDFHPGEQNAPLSYLYVIARSVNKRFSHEYLSAYCHLPMIGGVSPIPQFLYGWRKLPDEIVGSISSCFAELFFGEKIPPFEALHDQMLHEAEDKLIKHRYVNFLLYAAIAKCEQSGLTVEHPEQPEVLIGNTVADYCASHVDGITSGTAQTHFSFEVLYKGESFVFLVIAAYAATHKHKEYPARWRCSRIEFNQHFQYATTPRHWIVILDGIWTELFKNFDELLDKFTSAGANAVYDISSFSLCFLIVRCPNLEPARSKSRISRKSGEDVS